MRNVLVALVLSTALMLMLGGSTVGEVSSPLNLPTHGVILPFVATAPVVLANNGGLNTSSPFMTTAMDLPGQPLVLGGGLYNTMTRASSLSSLALVTAQTALQLSGTTSPLDVATTGNDSVPTASGGPGHVLIGSMVTANLANERTIGSWS